MIENILFDVDDTLYPSGEFAALARRNAIKAMLRTGLEHDEENLQKMLAEIIKEKGSNYQHHFDLLLERLKIENKSKFVAAAVGAYHDTKAAIQPFPDVPSVILKLRDGKYRLCIASNGLAVKQWDKLIRLKLAQYFERAFISEKMGVEKSTEFYRKIAENLETEPGKCLMVGDREDTDIIPAKEAGMRTVRIFRGSYADRPKETAADEGLTGFRELHETIKKLSR
jgi:putative hydrolase of the HAD superfamily